LGKVTIEILGLNLAKGSAEKYWATQKTVIRNKSKNTEFFRSDEDKAEKI
jgi:hypothetical protein